MWWPHTTQASAGAHRSSDCRDGGFGGCTRRPRTKPATQLFPLTMGEELLDVDARKRTVAARREPSTGPTAPSFIPA